jgi:hypothetical protein
VTIILSHLANIAIDLRKVPRLLYVIESRCGPGPSTREYILQKSWSRACTGN